MILNDANWLQGTGNQAYQTLAGPIMAGADIQTTITVTLDPSSVNASGGSYTNFAEIASAEDEDGNPQEDVDSEADDDPNNDGPVNDNETDNAGGDEDDHDPEEINYDIFDLALIKLYFK